MTNIKSIDQQRDLPQFMIPDTMILSSLNHVRNLTTLRAFTSRSVRTDRVADRFTGPRLASLRRLIDTMQASNTFHPKYGFPMRKK
mmetsp:Transcript_71813/g.192741  ORF Transcript_71813/g.192741 Transcript_71813/m.192741 type:complete len:86 (-) Transcript_71813:182-439(-)